MIPLHSTETSQNNAPYLVVLGNSQDAGFPHAGCHRSCCKEAWLNPKRRRFPACLGVVDPMTNQRWIFDCTPDFKEQLNLFDQIAPPAERLGVTGILLTHAHIGHYTGLIHLGREAIDSKSIATYAMPRMTQFLQTNGPWNQLIEMNNIELKSLANETTIDLNQRLSVTPLLVPHRDEFSETVGFIIRGPDHGALFLPDIDKWDQWTTKIEDVIKSVDLAYVDGTFFDLKEIGVKSMDVIPHPFVTESLKRFAPLPKDQRDKIRFIHFNHTNPLLLPESEAGHQVRDAGCHIAEQGELFTL